MMSVTDMDEQLNYEVCLEKEQLAEKVFTEQTTQTGVTGSGVDVVDDIRYKVDDIPPWYLCIVFGFQVG